MPEPTSVPVPTPTVVITPEPPREPATLPPAYTWPVSGAISTYYGWSHAGIDIVAGCGTAVAASADGTVEYAGWAEGGYGNFVILSHADGSLTRYAHLSEVWVWPGEWVGLGQGVGAVGNTGYSYGCHLHFEVLAGGYTVDPLSYLGK